MNLPRLDQLPRPETKWDGVGWPWSEQILANDCTMPSGKPWPKFSVVTPNYNFGHLIEKTIRSVLLQGYPNLEYIVIDGGSSDESVQVIRKYERWISHWVSERDANTEEAINKGFSKATGELLCWIASDDFYYPGALRRAAVELCSSDDVRIINGDVHITDEAGNQLRHVRSGRVTVDRLIRYWRKPGSIPPAPGMFFRRSLIEEIGLMDESLPRASDYDLWLRAVHLHDFRNVDQVFAGYAIHPGSKSGQGWRPFQQDWARVSRRHWGKPWELRYWLLWGEWSIYSLRKRHKRSKKVIFQSLINLAVRAQASRRQLSMVAWIVLAVVLCPLQSLKGKCGFRRLSAEAVLGKSLAAKIARCWPRRSASAVP